MLLKIQRIGSKSDVTPSWALFSHVLNVYYVTVTREKYEEMIRTHKDKGYQYPFDYTQVVPDSKRVVTAEVTRKNKTMLNIAFSSGYLLNDEGKTIERLV